MTEITRRTILAGAGVAAVAPLAASAPAQAAAPLAGKQAPGFYRYKVGTHEITVVTDGMTAGPLADGYVANAPKDAVNAALAANYLPKDKATHMYTPVVINTGAKLVVVDTGLGLGVFQQSKGAGGQFHGNLAAAGIDPKAVDTVIISHFHGDHIGGLLGADNKLAFPNAEVLVPAAEWAYWMDDGEMSRAPDLIKGQFTNARRVFTALGNKVTHYQADKEVAPGITSVATPGHTPGHMSFIVASGSDRMLLQIDITAGATAIFLQNPNWQLVFDTDKPLAEQTRRKMYDMAIAEKMLVQGYHFPFPSSGYIEKAGNGYRLIPAAWNPVV